MTMTTSEHAVERFVKEAADGDGSTPPVVRPALKTLLYDMAALVDPDAVNRDVEYGLRDGFPDLRRLVEWYQRAAVRTFGHLATVWNPEDIVYDETLQAATLHHPPDAVTPLPPEKAEAMRDLYEATVLLPACSDAYVDLRTSAGEYVGTDGANVDPYEIRPEDQANIAMRPGYQVLDRQQRRTLRELWGGFQDRRELLTWLESLNGPTAGELDGPLSRGAIADSVFMDYLVHERAAPKAQAYRVTIAATHLLPAFVDGVRSLSAGEAIELKREESAPTPSI